MTRFTRHLVLLLLLFATGLLLLLAPSRFPSSRDSSPDPGAEARFDEPLSGTLQRSDRLEPPSPRGVVVRPAVRPADETARDSTAEPAERIVFLREGMDANAMAARLGAEVAGRIEAARAYRLRFPDEQAARDAQRRLRAMPGVEAVDENIRIPRPASPIRLDSAQGGPLRPTLAAIDHDAPVVIGLIDSAVSYGGEAGDAFLLDSMISGSNESRMRDSAGEPLHGAAVAAAILDGLAAVLGEDALSGVKILPIDVFGDAETTTSFQVAEGILQALEGRAQVINMSLGGEASDRLVEAIVREAYPFGIVFVGAAGNEGSMAPSYPAAYPEVMSVTAADDDGVLLPNANYGTYIDVVAPGIVVFDRGTVRYISSGTSMSAGYISGAIAGLAESLEIPVSDAEEIVRHLFPPN